MRPKTTHVGVLACADLLDAVVLTKTAVVQSAREVTNAAWGSVDGDARGAAPRLGNAGLDLADAYVMGQAAVAATALRIGAVAVDTIVAGGEVPPPPNRRARAGRSARDA